MQDTDYNVGVFAFSERNQVWEHIMYILDLNIKAETELAVSKDIVGENRIHQCGRADALTNFKALLLEERKKGRVQAGLTPE
jgi:hypothetical protein